MPIPTNPDQPNGVAGDRTMPRRSALLAALTGATVLVSCAPFRGEQESSTEIEEKLRRDLAEAEARVYAEEGIPMLLACENLEHRGSGAPAYTPALKENAAWTARFHELVQILQRVRSNLTEQEAAKLVELLALEDLAAGGKAPPW